MRSAITAPLKYPGAKWSYSNWIVSFIPEHRFYVEPYFGSGAVLFGKEPAPYETINDADDLVVNFFRVCRDFPEDLARAIALTPFSRSEFENVLEDAAGQDIKLTGNSVEDARRFAIRCSMGFGSKLADRVGWRNTKHSNGPQNPEVWSKIPKSICQAAQRLKHVQIERTDGVKLIKACNAPDCLIYADPPYLAKSRNRKRIYRHEMMGVNEHELLLKALLEHQGPVLISGYDNDLYNDMLDGWYKEQKTGHANNAQGRVETLWMNFEVQIRF